MRDINSKTLTNTAANLMAATSITNPRELQIAD